MCGPSLGKGSDAGCDPRTGLLRVTEASRTPPPCPLQGAAWNSQLSVPPRVCATLSLPGTGGLLYQRGEGKEEEDAGTDFVFSGGGIQAETFLRI